MRSAADHQRGIEGYLWQISCLSLVNISRVGGMQDDSGWSRFIDFDQYE